MSADSNSLTPTPAGWFSPCVEYEGHGTAEFSDPRGSVEGSAKVRFDEYGSCTIELMVESFESERELHFGLMELLSGSNPVVGEKSVTMGFGGMDNLCTKLTIASPSGVFTARGKILYDLREHPVFSDKGRLRLYSIQSQFDADGAGVPRYWVVLLFNLVSEAVLRHTSLDRHPLRIYQTPNIPDGLAKDELDIAWFKANEKNKLIIFEFGGELGFIEGVHDFEERKNKLLARREHTLITAVMVGSTGADVVDLTNLKDWPVLGFLRVLGVATGIETGAPWVELRDASGALVRRLHVTLRRPSFSSGRGAIREDIHCTTGNLLNKYLSCPERGRPHLLTSMDYLVKAGLDGLTLEENCILLCRAFETICNAYGFKRQDLLADLDLSNSEKVRDVLKRASEEIRLVAGSVRAADLWQAASLDQIAKRTRETPAGIDRAFGLAVIDLLAHFGLPDVEIAERHYAANSTVYQGTWVQTLSRYRAECVHEGYFDLQDKKDLHMAFQVLRHLHDILLRLILKMLNYEGPYQPSTITLTAAEPVDWVKPDTRADLLGYEVPSP